MTINSVSLNYILVNGTAAIEKRYEVSVLLFFLFFFHMLLEHTAQYILIGPGMSVSEEDDFCN